MTGTEFGPFPPASGPPPGGPEYGGEASPPLTPPEPTLPESGRMPVDYDRLSRPTHLETQTSENEHQVSQLFDTHQQWREIVGDNQLEMINQLTDAERKERLERAQSALGAISIKLNLLKSPSEASVDQRIDRINHDHVTLFTYHQSEVTPAIVPFYEKTAQPAFRDRPLEIKLEDGQEALAVVMSSLKLTGADAEAEPVVTKSILRDGVTARTTSASFKDPEGYVYHLSYRENDMNEITDVILSGTSPEWANAPHSNANDLAKEIKIQSQDQQAA